MRVGFGEGESFGEGSKEEGVAKGFWGGGSEDGGVDFLSGGESV